MTAPHLAPTTAIGSADRATLRLPPRDFLPPSLDPVLDEYDKAEQVWTTLALRVTDLAGELAIADAEDARFHIATAREGGSTEALGTPARDELEKDHRTLGHREQAAYALLLECRGRVVRALAQVKDDALAQLERTAQQRADDYTAAAGALLQARMRYRRARDLKTWWLTLDGRGRSQWPPPGGAGAEPDHHALRAAMIDVANATASDTGAVRIQEQHAAASAAKAARAAQTSQDSLA